MHRSPTPNPKPLKQNNVHETPYKFNAHKVANLVLTKNTQIMKHQTFDCQYCIMFTNH